MKRFSLLLVIIGIFGLLVENCEKSDDPDEAGSGPFDPPSGISFVTYEDSVAISWNHTPDAGDTGFVGYYLYTRIAPLENVETESLFTYRIFDDPVDQAEYTVMETVSTSKHYYGLRSVKIVDAETTYSELSSEVHTSPTLWGGGMVVESDAGSTAGIDFSEDSVHAMTLANLNFVDIYLGVDSENNLQWRSPELYGDDWADRNSAVKVLGTGLFSDFYAAGSDGWLDTVKVDLGKIYAFRTPDNHYVKLIVEDLSGIYPNRTVQFSFAYQDVVNYDRF